MSIRLSWGFPSGAADATYTEVYYSDTPSFDKATPLAR